MAKRVTSIYVPFVDVTGARKEFMGSQSGNTLGIRHA
jgi:hypothetical protein